jgi:hypothetical protein
LVSALLESSGQRQYSGSMQVIPVKAGEGRHCSLRINTVIELNYVKPSHLSFLRSDSRLISPLSTVIPAIVALLAAASVQSMIDVKVLVHYQVMAGIYGYTCFVALRNASLQRP